MKKIKTILIDDNKDHLELLAKLLRKYPEIEIDSLINDPVVALENILETQPNVLFLDIQMPVKSGFDLMDEISVTNLYPDIIFVTSHNEYAIKAFEYAAFDYLVKPIDPERLDHAVQRILVKPANTVQENIKKLQETYDKLIFKSSDGYVLVRPEDIILVEADGNYSVISLENQNRITLSTSIGELEEMFDNNFFRSHRSAILNLRKLYRVNSRKRECILQSNGRDYTCKISKERIPELLSIAKNSNDSP